ncbi:MAG: hypothetical protein JWN08_2767 [Frankiales bacterium]|jgi:hypothetical protein|nr:hypothetical protein [Frankiales bacterium]
MTKNKRGRESAGDMVRSLGLVMLVVVAIWFFAQPPDSDEAEVRAVDPSADVSAFRADVPGAATPAGLPERWRATSSSLRGEPRSLRIGYVTPGERYAEYAASTLPPAEAVEELVGGARSLDAVQVEGAPWEQYRDADGSLSLVRAYGPVTVVVGTLRATATLDELRLLAGSLTVG